MKSALFSLPKVVLHEHIEGSVTPKMAQFLAKKHAVTLADDFLYPEGDYDSDAFPYGRYQYDESDFGAFVIAYDVVASLVRDPDDYYLILKDYLTRNAQQGLVYCEMITSAFHLCYRGDALDKNADENTLFDAPRYHKIIDALERAMREVEQEYGTITRLQACGVRHLSLENINQSVDFIIDNPRDCITGFNIAGNEMAGTFSDFHYLHEHVASIPLEKSYHAGEICGPESIRNALFFGAKRIGHGIAAIEDEALMETLIQDNVLLEIAPTSNRILVTQFEQAFTHHPLRKLYEKGVRLSINTDDAGLFGTDIGKEYQLAQSEFGFSRVELLDVSLCALEAAFIDAQTKQTLIEKVYAQFTPEDWSALAEKCEQLSATIDTPQEQKEKQQEKDATPSLTKNALLIRLQERLSFKK